MHLLTPLKMSFVSSVCESANVESKDEENGKTLNQKCNGHEIDVPFVFEYGAGNK
jgi:hypothetical protein